MAQNNALCRPGVPQILGCASSRNFVPMHEPSAVDESWNLPQRRRRRQRQWPCLRHHEENNGRGSQEDEDSEEQVDDSDEEQDIGEEGNDGFTSIYARSAANDDGETLSLTPRKRSGSPKTLKRKLFLL